MRRNKRRSHATDHLVTFRAKMFIVHNKSNRFILPSHNSFMIIFAATELNCPFSSNSSGGIDESSMQGVITGRNWLSSLPVNSKYFSIHCSAWPFIL